MPPEDKIPITPERLLADLDALGRFGRRPEGGLDRAAFSPAYREALDWLQGRFAEAGLAARLDPAGNLIGRLGPAEGPTVVCGSHIDAVPGGGVYDGALGVLAGLECARTLVGQGRDLARALEIVAFADEEGAYLSLMGSRAMTGQLEKAEIASARGPDGRPLAQALADFGLDPARLGQAARPASDFAAYLELHIEQGPVLEAAGLEIGVVERIVGIQEAELVFTGEQAHAGTTPLPLRRDALRAAAETVAQALAAAEQDFGDDLRLTFGALRADPGAANVVPGEARLAQEIRGPDEAAMAALERRVREIAGQVAARHRVGLQIQCKAPDLPAVLAPNLTQRIAAACVELGCGYRRMVSGAGHDAQVLAQMTEAAMIFVPSRAGLSHNPAEDTDPAHIALGAAVLYQVLEGLLVVR